LKQCKKERLNSDLEPEKKILIPEKGGVKIDEIQTMTPSS